MTPTAAFMTYSVATVVVLGLLIRLWRGHKSRKTRIIPDNQVYGTRTITLRSPKNKNRRR